MNWGKDWTRQLSRKKQYCENWFRKGDGHHYQIVVVGEGQGGTAELMNVGGLFLFKEYLLTVN